MLFLLAALLGLIQALTEFLPVSSSGHLLIARSALDFNVADGLAFDVAVHVGTLFAILVCFRSDVMRVIHGAIGWFRRRDSTDADQRLAAMVLVACVPAALVGLFFEHAIEVYFRHPGVVVVTLIAGALLFWFAEHKWRGENSLETLTHRGALAVGVAQVLALVPGVSRSGITIVLGMACGLRREEAARFSFVMASPLLAGAGAKKALDLAGSSLAPGEGAAFAVGAIVSAAAGWVVVRFLVGFLRTHSLSAFAWYRVALAAVVAAWIWL